VFTRGRGRKEEETLPRAFSLKKPTIRRISRIRPEFGERDMGPLIMGGWGASCMARPGRPRARVRANWFFPAKKDEAAGEIGPNSPEQILPAMGAEKQKKGKNKPACFLLLTALMFVRTKGLRCGKEPGGGFPIPHGDLFL